MLLGIHKALRILYSENVRAYRWVSTPSLHFSDKRPLDVMLQGQISDLQRVRAYLNATRS